MKIFIGADHKGFKLKEKLKIWLYENNYDFDDLGANKYDKTDDYTIFAQRVASVIAEFKDSRGVLICGSGVGVDIVSNKFDGVRAGLAKSADQIASARRDDDINVLVLAADFTTEKEATKILKTFLETQFDKKPRHKKRLDTISHLEANN